MFKFFNNCFIFKERERRLDFVPEKSKVDILNPVSESNGISLVDNNHESVNIIQ